MACGKWMGYDCLGTAVMNVCKTQMPCENVVIVIITLLVTRHSCSQREVSRRSTHFIGLWL